MNRTDSNPSQNWPLTLRRLLAPPRPILTQNWAASEARDLPHSPDDAFHHHRGVTTIHQGPVARVMGHTPLSERHDREWSGAIG